MTRFPYGVSNFETLILNDYVFVDKTCYIEKLESLGERYIFFLRPRRFGKSLFVSMLSYYYDVLAKDRFQDLFGKFYIGRHPTANANNYMVLKFEFSRINTETKETTFDGFRINTLAGVDSFCSRYGFDYAALRDVHEPADILKGLFGQIEKTTARKVYILIDEYDHFANEILSFNPTNFIDIISKTGFVRKFYESIKTATFEGTVDRLFVTGVTPITLDSMTSGFNIAQNLSLEAEFNSLMGFTEAETLGILKPVLPDENDLKYVYSDMKRFYNGYLFHARAAESVFNPDMVLYFLSKATRSRDFAYPDHLIDTNISSDYTKVSRLFHLGDLNANLKILNDLLINKELSAGLTPQFSLQKSFSKDNFVSLLFYMGIITIKEAYFSLLKFAMPNYVIEGLYLQYFADLISERHQLKFDTNQITQALIEMSAHNHPASFIAIVENVLHTLSFQDFKNFDEKYIKVIICAYLSLSNLYFIKSEYEVPGGYVDLLLLNKPPVIPDYQFALELKYLKKSQAKQLATVKEKAIAQLRGYLATDEARAIRTLQGYVLVFVGQKCKVCEKVERP